jgi:UDP-N-acetylmuramyl tripeptide synthase
MKVVNFKVFQGRNIYSHKRCIRLNLDLDGYSEIPSKDISDLNENLIQLLPKLNSHRCGIDKRLTDGIYLAHIIQHIILVLHNMLGVCISYGKSRKISDDNYYVIYQYEYSNTGIEASNIAVDLVNSLINKKPFDLDLRLTTLREILLKEQLGLSTLNICNEAKKRGIPILRMGEDNSMLQLGYGKYSKTIQGTLSFDTSAIAVNITQDKLLTKEVLSMHFLPVATGMKVKNKTHCMICARDITYPVVLKPQFGNQGIGVIPYITNDIELSNAYDLLIKDYEDIIIEKCINGLYYRVCYVYGDIVEVSNLTTSDFAIDNTDLICDENIEICKRVASAIGLDICEIDLICADISKALNGGVIIEINATPGIRNQHNPNIREKSNVAGHIVDKLFKNTPINFPLVAITGTNGKTTTTRLIGHILKNAGYTVGMTTTSGIYIDDKCIFKGDTTGPNSALVVLTDKNVDAAVLETARGGIIRRGLAYDLADVGVITNITEDHLGMDEVETMDELAKVKALVGEAVKKDGYVVINGDDNMSASILHRFKSKIIIFSKDKNNVIIKSNIENGGYGIYVDNDNIIIQNKTCCEKLIEIKDIGITLNGALKYNTENAMAATAAAIALGINYDTIKKSLMSFYCNANQNPGRFNIYTVNNIKVILDYGHNLQSYRCVLDGVKNLKHNKLIGIIGSPGDRQESYMLEIGKCAGENLDYIFIKENEDRRGRAVGEVAAIIEKGILSSKFNIINIEKVFAETKALKAALDFASPEDIIVAFVEYPGPLIEIINKVNQITSNPNLLTNSSIIKQGGESISG